MRHMTVMPWIRSVLSIEAHIHFLRFASKAQYKSLLVQCLQTLLQYSEMPYIESISQKQTYRKYPYCACHKRKTVTSIDTQQQCVIALGFIIPSSLSISMLQITVILVTSQCTSITLDEVLARDLQFDDHDMLEHQEATL
jgi:hypothetical protein